MARPKVFCVGANKTGTTSMQHLLQMLGYAVAPQGPAERMLEDWARRDFSALIKFCERHEAFQDIPFCLPFTFQAVDQAFPGSRFILTRRRDADEWFESLVRFERKALELDREVTADDLKAQNYRYPGWWWRSHVVIWGINEDSLYDPARYKAQYERHNASIRDYFSQRPGDLLEIEIADPEAAAKVCDFLGLPRADISMPHVNSSRAE
ncbi:MAG TPA: sulfotransferase [Gammaproteobacteria bacterium]|nr:sulfotransferase [Gammaproteobacteria bacterium]